MSQQLTDTIIDNRLDDFKHLLGENTELAKQNCLKQFPRPQRVNTADAVDCIRRSRRVTVFELVVRYYRHDMLAYLLSLGVDVNHIHNCGATSLHICVQGI